MIAVFEKLTALNAQWAEAGLSRQVLDPESRYYGGVTDPANGIAWPNHHAGTPVWMAVWSAELVNPASTGYHSRELAERLELAADYMLRFQHEDGSISPGWTNFHSPPDTGFVIVGYAQAYLLLERDGSELLRPAADKMRLFLERTVPLMLTGGVHTPNHRWVLTAALAFLHRLFALPELKERAGQWLAEGMDATPDGEWTERSNGIYNAVSDIMLIHAARMLDLPQLLEPVRRNLHALAYLVHPSGEVVTDYSGRQDFGQIHTLDSYLLALQTMAYLDESPRLAALAALAGEAVNQPASAANNPLIGFLLEPEIAAYDPAPEKLPTEYRMLLNGGFPRSEYLAGIETAGHHNRIAYSRPHTDFGAPVARLRSGDTSVTMMAETSSFFALRHGSLRLLGIQIASYFSPGYIPMQNLEDKEGGYLLSAEQHKGYVGPIPAQELPATSRGEVSPWYLLPHQKRPSTHTQELRMEVRVTETDDGFDLLIRCAEPAEVMTQLSLILGGETRIEGAGVEPVSDAVFFWTEGTVRCENGNDWMELDGGMQEHHARTVSGISYPSDCRTLLINRMTPFEQTISIRLSPAGKSCS